MQQNELTAQLLERVAALEQENARLRSKNADLQLAQQAEVESAREQEKAAQERAAELAKANEAVQALSHQVSLALETLRLAEQAKQAAIAREQEKAAQARVVQLAKANAALKQTLDVLATEPELDRSLGHVLQVTTEHLNSSSAALWLFNPDSNTFSLHLVYLDGGVIPATPENADRLSGQWIRGRDLSRDLTLKKHIRDRAPVIYHVDDSPEITPPQYQFMERLGVKTLLGVPLLLGSEITGSFTVRFTEKRQFQAEELELTQALAHQATLAIQLLHKAEEAKQAAIFAERNRLAGEIHDTLAQAFTGISIQLGVAKWLLQQDSAAVAPILDRVNQLAHTGLTEARRSVWSLYPAAEDYADLAQKLSHCVEQWTYDTTLEVTLQIHGTPRLVPPMVGQNLLRVGQESITNALKHAQASKLVIALIYTAQSVSLSVRDNGRGFSPELNTGGFGLISMSERADRIGGQLIINSQPGEGTEIGVQVPIE